VAVSNLSIFELAAKGAELAATGRVGEAKVIAGLEGILYDADIEQVDFAETEVMSRALAMRKEIGDFIDCVIIVSAAAKADAVLTEDDELRRISLDLG